MPSVLILTSIIRMLRMLRMLRMHPLLMVKATSLSACSM
jgi:hypothetical protein